MQLIIQSWLNFENLKSKSELNTIVFRSIRNATSIKLDWIKSTAFLFLFLFLFFVFTFVVEFSINSTIYRQFRRCQSRTFAAHRTAANERTPIATVAANWPEEPETGSKPEVNDSSRNDTQHSIANILIRSRDGFNPNWNFAANFVLFCFFQ